MNKKEKLPITNSLEAWKVADLLKEGRLSQFLGKDTSTQLETLLQTKLSAHEKGEALAAILQKNMESKLKNPAIPSVFPAMPRQRKANGFRKKATAPWEKVASSMASKMKQATNVSGKKPKEKPSASELMLEMAAHLNLSKTPLKSDPLQSKKALSKQKNSLELFRQRIEARSQEPDTEETTTGEETDQ